MPRKKPPLLFERNQTMLTLSSEHLHLATKGWLNIVRGGLPYIKGKLCLNGAIFGATPDPGERVPYDLRACLTYARINGYTWVMFVEAGVHRVRALELLDPLDDPFPEPS